MVDVVNFYIDDSGTRHPAHDPGKRPEHGYDWFALGGILVRDNEEADARALHSAFCKNWGIECPLHSSEIRSQNGRFLWLRGLSEKKKKDFYEDLYQLMRRVPAVALACVIDRPGYNGRYYEMYKKEPWSLCKTAFSVAVERAAKYARNQKCKLRVSPERCNKPEDRLLEEYYGELKTTGMPFDTSTSKKYQPLTANQFHQTLYEFRRKAKTSPMAQLADLYLWPICMGGYHASNFPYSRLMKDGKLIECVLPKEALETEATKYSCFELVERKP